MEAGNRMTKAYNSLCVEYFPGDPYRCKLFNPLRAYSDVLGRDIEAPAGFINDMESVPLLKGTNNESGVWHDYFSRSDSDPIIDKTTCARVYLEFQRYYDHLELRPGAWNFVRDLPNRTWDFIRRWVKTGTVWVAPRYFHRHKVMATYGELSGQSLEVW